MHVRQTAIRPQQTSERTSARSPPWLAGPRRHGRCKCICCHCTRLQRQRLCSGTLGFHPELAPAHSSDTAEHREARCFCAAQTESDIAANGSRLIVGPDVKLKGAEILDCDTLVVEGRVEAMMDSRVIRITVEQGAFSGKVGIDIAEIFGEFDGELTARQQLIIHASGRVHGKIRYGKLLVEEGGTLSGDIQSLDSNVINPTIKSSLNDTQPRTTSALSEKEVNAQMKSYLSTVAG